MYKFVRLAELYYAGSHGMDIKGPAKGSKYKKVSLLSEYQLKTFTPSFYLLPFPYGYFWYLTFQGSQGVLCQPASEFLPMIDEVYKLLVEKTKSTPGAKVENNKFCLSVHYRCVDEKVYIFIYIPTLGFCFLRILSKM